MVSKFSKEFIRFQSLSGILVLAAALFGLIIARVDPWLSEIAGTNVTFSIGSVRLQWPVLELVNRLCLPILTLLIGLECKRALLDGEFSGSDRLRLPALAALGCTVIPAAFLAVGSDPDFGAGWMIALGVDMAVGLFVLSVLGERVPDALKSLFKVMAMFAFLGGILVLAAVHLKDLSWDAWMLAGMIMAVLLAMNRFRVTAVSLYLIPTVALWTVLAESMALAALAGLVLAISVPFQSRGQSRSPALELEQDMLPLACLVIAPLFALTNALPVHDLDWGAMMETEVFWVLFGLFPLRVVGVFGLCWTGVRTGLAALPPGVGWKEFFGVSMLLGAGFSMNLFLATVIPPQAEGGQDGVRMAILVGTVLCCLCGYVYLRHVLSRRRNTARQRF